MFSVSKVRRGNKVSGNLRQIYHVTFSCGGKTSFDMLKKTAQWWIFLYENCARGCPNFFFFSLSRVTGKRFFITLMRE